MKISIVIPSLNEGGQITVAIKSAWQSGAAQVIVADGGSSDGSRELAGAENCVVVDSPRGRGNQLNAGASAATGDVLLFLHADNSLVASGCDQIRDALQNENIKFGAFKQSIQNNKRIYRWIELGNESRVKWQGLIYGDQAMFIRRRVFEEVGGFPDIELMEDFELARRLRRIGKPKLLDGPTFVDARRWEKTGPVRQTIRNWFLSAAYRCGASPEWLAKRY
ncbi:MAG: TIGR04283 family arsenosugar biosynthesis glycosyltransferase [Mariniblastus sp.]